jgi:guanylate kinase
MMSKGTLIIISGPSGSGKDTVLQKLFQKMPELKFSISSVSRPMRTSEVEGEKYNFVTREKFEDMINNDQLLEYNVYLGNYYGTPREPVDTCIKNGGEIVLEVDVNGAANVRKNCKDSFSIFIMPPSLEVLKARLNGRGTETPEVVEERLTQAISEIKRSNEYDYIVVNDVLNECVNEVFSIIRAERCRVDRLDFDILK